MPDLCDECKKRVDDGDHELCEECKALIDDIMANLTDDEKAVMLAIAEICYPMHCGSVMDQMGPNKWHCLHCDYEMEEEDE